VADVHPNQDWFWRESIALGILTGAIAGTLNLNFDLTFSTNAGMTMGAALWVGLPMAAITPTWSGGLLRALRYGVLTLIALSLACVCVSSLIWGCAALL
jgi:hypothetical protein